MFALESPAVWLGHGYLQLVAAANSGLAESTAEGTAGGEVLAQVVEPDETRQAITFLIVCLVGIALLLSILTVWYWHFTSPKRRASSLLTELGHYESDPSAATSAPESPPVLTGASGPSSAPDHLRLPAPAPVPAIDDRTTSAPAFATASPTAVASVGTPPLSPPELPTNTPRRVAGPDPQPATPRRAAEARPATPRRIEVAARTATNGAAGQTDVPAERAEPIFPDRVPKVDRRPQADPVPSPVETKTGTTTPRRANTGGVSSAATVSGAAAGSGAATVTHRGPLAAPKPTPSAGSSMLPRAAGPTRPAAASSEPETGQQPDKATLAPTAVGGAGSAAGQEGLSDDDWAAVMQSAFSKLNK